MLISPTDRDLHTVGRSSSVPERWGCDILIRTDTQWIGIQRKTIVDLIASVHDGRLTKEVMQMACCDRLDVKMLVIEGEAHWTTDGALVGKGYGSQWTRAQHLGMLWSVRAKGVWVDWTRDLADTRVWLKMLESWAKKGKHQALERRPNAIGAWGKPDSREFGSWLLMGLPGVGPELAGRIVDHFGGRVPWLWSVGEAELMEVPGIGKKRAREMLNSLSSP